MVKLNHNEVQDKIEEEDGGLPDIPANAHSEFYFEIEENVADLVKEMRELPHEYLPQKRFVDEETGEVRFDGNRNSKAPWNFVERKENSEEAARFGDFSLQDKFSNCSADVWQKDGGLGISTAWSGYFYDIRQKATGGCTVEFSGPVNGLLNQNLLPSMTYVHGTLQGKFVDAENDRDLTSYMDMGMFGVLRAMKNGERKGEERTNMQDYYGYQINSHFNNEIPFLPLSDKMTYDNIQELKNKKAQENYGKNESVKDKVRWNKERVRRAIERVRGKVSGAVIADDIAESKISGKEKRDITPEIGAEIRKRKSVEK